MKKYGFTDPTYYVNSNVFQLLIWFIYSFYVYKTRFPTNAPTPLSTWNWKSSGNVDIQWDIKTNVIFHRMFCDMTYWMVLYYIKQVAAAGGSSQRVRDPNSVGFKGIERDVGWCGRLGRSRGSGRCARPAWFWPSRNSGTCCILIGVERG